MKRKARAKDSVGMQMYAAIRTVIRWGTRADVHRRLRTIEGVALSPTDTFLLGALADFGPLRATQLAEWQGVDKSTVTPQLRRLEGAGLIARSPDPVDRRASLLSLTRKGSRVLRKFRSAGAQLLDEKLADWPEQEREELARLLGKLADTLDEVRTVPGESAP